MQTRKLVFLLPVKSKRLSSRRWWSLRRSNTTTLWETYGQWVQQVSLLHQLLYHQLRQQMNSLPLFSRRPWLPMSLISQRYRRLSELTSQGVPRLTPKQSKCTDLWCSPVMTELLISLKSVLTLPEMRTQTSWSDNWAELVKNTLNGLVSKLKKKLNSSFMKTQAWWRPFQTQAWRWAPSSVPNQWKRLCQWSTPDYPIIS